MENTLIVEIHAIKHKFNAYWLVAEAFGYNYILRWVYCEGWNSQRKNDQINSPQFFLTYWHI